MNSKKTLREEYLVERNKITPSERASLDKRLCENLVKLIAKHMFHTIFSYRTFGSEPSLRGIPDASSVTTAVPVINPRDKSMEFYPIGPNQTYTTNKFGIEEPFHPLGAPLIPDNHTLVVLPCLAVSKSGYRLGYGGGYYDRYLARFPQAQRAGILYRQFLVPDMPVESHDQKLHHLILEDQILTFNP
ncbi:MAG: 5-formyltetrahydrofolate cyclo-ligase [Oligoflexales bacterium]